MEAFKNPYQLRILNGAALMLAKRTKEKIYFQCPHGKYFYKLTVVEFH